MFTLVYANTRLHSLASARSPGRLPRLSLSRLAIPRLFWPALWPVLAVSAASGAGCGSGSPAVTPSSAPDAGAPDAANTTDATTPIPFVASSPYTYVAKVKNILIGLPPTDPEVASVVSATDPQSQLRTLIQGWMAVVDPSSAAGMTYYAEKMLVFFKLATQQTQVAVTAFSDQAYPGQIDVNPSTANLLVQNAIESFARTMVESVVEGAQPLTQVATTTTFMMTTALMEAYAFIDTWQVNDSGKVVDAFARANPGLMLTVGSAQVPIAQSVDPTSPGFMHWTDPDVAAGAGYSLVKNQGVGCATDPIAYPASSLALHYLLHGAILGHTLASAVKCGQYGGTKAAPQLGNAANGGASDFGDWRMVTIRQPMLGESTTTFYDLPALRSASTLVLDLPRVGFFTTPAFFANWQTNLSNTMRVTTNQTLIVALGAMVDGTDQTVAIPGDGGLPPGLDSAHAGPGTACYSCHQTLDPTRSIFASTYSWFYHAQDTAAFSGQPGEFAFRGVTAYPHSVYDLAAILSTHPLFGPAWVQKLCEYSNSQACETNDPEFVRIADDFQTGGYSWSALVVDLLSSPLTTDDAVTQTTTDEGATVAVSRRDHFCAAMNFRLGFADVCALLPTTAPVSSTIAQIAGGFPSDGYGRGAVEPVLPNAPSLFYRAGTENMCEAIAQLVIDVTAAKQVSTLTWSSTSPDPAIVDFTEIVAGLVPSDPRHDPVLAILRAHYAAALAEPGTTATSALRSTFVAACGAPSAVSVGL
jgi:hypothetical protein